MSSRGRRQRWESTISATKIIGEGPSVPGA
jgi:hypothetical protein